MVAAYFPEWGVYDRNFPVDKIPAANLNHILYGFIPICGGDGINDGLKTIEGGNSFRVLQNDCRADLTIPWRSTTHGLRCKNHRLASPAGTTQYKGNLASVMALKKAHPDLKVLPSIGGWTLSDPFFHMGDPAIRARFVSSVKSSSRHRTTTAWISTGNSLAAAVSENLGNPQQDKATYTALMHDLRTMLNELSAQTNRTYELTSAIGAGRDKIRAWITLPLSSTSIALP